VFRAVIFDWRGTLVTTLTEHAWVQAALARLHRDTHPAQINELVAAIRTASGQPDRLEAAGVDSDAGLHRSTYLQVFRDAGLDDALAGALYDVESDAGYNSFAADASATLRVLTGRGLRIAVCSDIHFNIRPAFAAAGRPGPQRFDRGVFRSEHRRWFFRRRRHRGARLAHADRAVSISWGQSEDGWTGQAPSALDQVFIDAVALGVTVCVASGDNGSSDGATDGTVHVDFPASSPHARDRPRGLVLLRPTASQPEQHLLQLVDLLGRQVDDEPSFGRCDGSLCGTEPFDPARGEGELVTALVQGLASALEPASLLQAGNGRDEVARVGMQCRGQLSLRARRVLREVAEHAEVRGA